MKMMKAAAFLVLMISFPAFAGVKLGQYQGVDAQGAACGFEVKGVSFADGVKHPLNERVEIVADGQSFVLAHSPVIDENAGTVLFDHDHLTGSKGVKGGAFAAIVRMEHSENKDGPAEFVQIFHDYKNPADSKKRICGSLLAP